MNVRHRAGTSLALAVAVALVAPIVPAATAADTPPPPSAAVEAAGVGLKPMMGFNNWARFLCESQLPLNGAGMPHGGDAAKDYSFQDFMEDQAFAMKDLGLVDVGYTNVTVDDCWMANRTAGAPLTGAKTWFPNSTSANPRAGFDTDLTAYVDYIHSLGEEAGLYNAGAANTCQAVLAGSLGNEALDAATYVKWGVDSLKYDNCGSTVKERETRVPAMASALEEASRDSARKILLNISAPAGSAMQSLERYDTLEWVRAYGQTWRVGPDIALQGAAQKWGHGWSWRTAKYQMGVYQSFILTAALSRYVSPGNINDPDMLLMGDTALTPAEERSQFALWSALGAPLVISGDLRKLLQVTRAVEAGTATTAQLAANEHYAETLATLRNTDIIAVDQDDAGIGGYLASNDNSSPTDGIDVVVKPLANGDRAVVVLNKGASKVQYSLPLARVGFTDPGCTYTATNLWDKTQSTVTEPLALSIDSHDNAMFRISAAGCASTPAATGQITLMQVKDPVVDPILPAEYQTYSSKDKTAYDKSQANMNSSSSLQHGFCLESTGKLLSEVGTARCDGTDSQQWSFNADGTVQRYGTQFCIDRTAPDVISKYTGVKGTFLALKPCDATSPTQVVSYHRNGQLEFGDGKCFDLWAASEKSLAVRSMAIGAYTCAREVRFNQMFTAPHAGTVDSPRP